MRFAFSLEQIEMTKTYGATNPEQIISLFEMRANVVMRPASATMGTRAQVAAARATEYTWKEAADILRNTEFVGWTTGTPVVETNDLDRVEEIKNSNTPADRLAWDRLQTAAAATPSAFLSLDDAKLILEALTRPNAIESARKYMGPRENHAAAIAAIKAAVMRAEAGRK
jgi:hypothetical protein